MHKGIPLLLAISFLMALIAGVISSPSVPFKPNFPVLSLTERQEIFLTFMFDKVHAADINILASRKQIIDIYNNWKNFHQLSHADKVWLNTIAAIYKVNDFDINDEAKVTELLNRVDIIPPSLMLAQAINESAWGTSRFAVQADNFFGQYCYAEGCGVLPGNRPAGETYLIQRFPSVQASVDNYIYNLNTNSRYYGLRLIRDGLRKTGRPITGYALAEGLINYSTKREGYITLIQSVIINFGLAKFDAQVAS